MRVWKQTVTLGQERESGSGEWIISSMCTNDANKWNMNVLMILITSYECSNSRLVWEDVFCAHAVSTYCATHTLGYSLHSHNRYTRLRGGLLLSSSAQFTMTKKRHCTVITEMTVCTGRVWLWTYQPGRRQFYKVTLNSCRSGISIIWIFISDVLHLFVAQDDLISFLYSWEWHCTSYICPPLPQCNV